MATERGDSGTDPPANSPVEEAAGASAIDREFEWSPEGWQPFHPAVSVAAYTRYFALAVVIVAVVIGAVAAGPAILSGAQTAVDTVESSSLFPQLQGPSAAWADDDRTPTPTTSADVTPTATETPMGAAYEEDSPTETPSPTPTPPNTPTPSPTATPTPTSSAPSGGSGSGTGGGGGGSGSGSTSTPTSTVTPTPTSTATPESTPTPTATPTATPTPTPTSTATPTPTPDPKPTIDQFEIEDNSECQRFLNPCDLENRAEFTITWDTSNADEVTVTVTRDGNQVDQFQGESGEETVSEEDQYGEDYTFEIVAKNDAGETREEETRTAGG